MSICGVYIILKSVQAMDGEDTERKVRRIIVGRERQSILDDRIDSFRQSFTDTVGMLHIKLCCRSKLPKVFRCHAFSW